MIYKPRWDLGLIPCSATKNPSATTAQTLYRGGPFATMMKHARQRCDKIIIMSARYGLLLPHDPVVWYEAYLPDLDANERRFLAQRIQMQLLFPDRSLWPGARVLSYLPLAYHQFLRGTQGVGELAVEPGFTAHWRYRRPYHNLPSLVMISTLVHEIRNYGTHPARR